MIIIIMIIITIVIIIIAGGEKKFFVQFQTTIEAGELMLGCCRASLTI